MSRLFSCQKKIMRSRADLPHRFRRSGKFRRYPRCPGSRFRARCQQFSDAQYRAHVVPSSLDVKLQATVIESYNRLKHEWHVKPMTAYREAKREFIQWVLRKNQTPL